jgi:hypothetical protein
MSRPKRKILILGYARHGKDTVAEILRDDYAYRFVSSSMFVGERVCRPYLEARGITYASMDECFADRVNHRAAWHTAIAEWNQADPTRLAQELFEVADIYVGMRSAREYQATKHLFDEIWWVDASGRGLPPEDKSSMNIVYEPDHMRWIDNNHTLARLCHNIADAMSSVG